MTELYCHVCLFKLGVLALVNTVFKKIAKSNSYLWPAFTRLGSFISLCKRPSVILTLTDFFSFLIIFLGAPRMLKFV